MSSIKNKKMQLSAETAPPKAQLPHEDVVQFGARLAQFHNNHREKHGQATPLNNDEKQLLVGIVRSYLPDSQSEKPADKPKVLH
jgi:hypothetical protein